MYHQITVIENSLTARKKILVVIVCVVGHQIFQKKKCSKIDRITNSFGTSGCNSSAQGYKLTFLSLCVRISLGFENPLLKCLNIFYRTEFINYNIIYGQATGVDGKMGKYKST